MLKRTVKISLLFAPTCFRPIGRKHVGANKRDGRKHVGANKRDILTVRFNILCV